MVIKTPYFLNEYNPISIKDEEMDIILNKWNQLGTTSSTISSKKTERDTKL